MKARKVIKGSVPFVGAAVLAYLGGLAQVHGHTFGGCGLCVASFVCACWGLVQ